MTLRTDPSIPPQQDPSWPGHIRATLKLGLPLIGVQLAQMSIHVTDTVMIGWLGAADLAASVLATQLFFVVFIICTGFAHALVPLASTAAAQDDARGVRRATRMGFWAVLGMAILLTPLLWFSEALLISLWQKPELAERAQSYLRIAFLSLFPTVIVAVFRSYLAALERAGIVFWATLAGTFLNAFLNWVFIFGNLGAPALGIEGAAIASVGTVILTLLVLVAYARMKEDLRQYAIFVRLWRPDWAALREIIRMGLAISATLLAEVGLFAAASLMIGQFGTIPLAAHGIALQIISVIFMIPLGLSSAATVRAGRAVGRQDPQGLGRAGTTVLLMALSIAALGALVLWLFPEALINLFLDPETSSDIPAIIAYGVPLLAVAAAFQIVDTLQVISLGLLRGIKDIKVPAIMAVFSYWGVGVPVAWFLAFRTDLGGVGVWTGLALGLGLAALLLTGRFLLRNRFALIAVNA
ncbi:MAG: MATE family efflux transporter [Pseudomonadota bacterium]